MSDHKLQQQLSPDRLLAALPDSYMNINSSSTPQCRCQLQLPLSHNQLSPCTPNSSGGSSLRNFSDSSASFASQELPDDPAEAAHLVDARRRLRRMRLEENHLRRLVADYDSRVVAYNDRLGAAAADKELLAMQRMSVNSVLRTVQTYVTAKSEEVAASTAAYQRRRPDTGAFWDRGDGKCEGSFGAEGADSVDNSCGLLDF